MSSEFLIAVPHELPRQDNLINVGEEGSTFDVNYANNNLEQENLVTVPGFSCIRSFPFNQKMKFPDISVPTHSVAKRHVLDDELELSLPKLMKLQSELTNYRSETAADIVDAVKSQVIKNDIILGEVIEHHSSNKSGRKDASVAERSLQHLAHEVLDTGNTGHISLETTSGDGCATAEREDSDCSGRTSSDQQQIFLKTETEHALLGIQNVSANPASQITGQDCVTESVNLLLNSEKQVFFGHEFVDTEAEGNDYHSNHESFNLSEFLICPTAFEQKLSCDELLLHSIQKEDVFENNSTAGVDASNGKETVDSHITFHSKSEILGHPSTTFPVDNKSNSKNVGGSTVTRPLCETQQLLLSTKEGNSTDLFPNKMTDNVVKREELSIKEEVEDPIQHSDQVHNADLLHNRELDLVDWLMSLGDQGPMLENVSTLTGSHQVHSHTPHDEHSYVKTAHKENLASVLLQKPTASKECAMKLQTRNGNKILDEDLSTPKLTDESESVHVEDNYSDRANNCTESSFNHRFLQNLYPDAAHIPHPQKKEASLEKGKNTYEEFLLAGLSTHTSLGNDVAQIQNTNLQPLENKPGSIATSYPNASDDSVKVESDTIRKHHKKEIIKKFSLTFSNDGKYDTLRLSQDDKRQIAVEKSDLPSTSATVTNGDKCVDCIVISDSDDSVIEFHEVKCNIKKRHTKSSPSGSSKTIQLGSRRSSRNSRSSLNEESSGQQVRNSTIRSNIPLECIVLSDSDDESSKSALAEKKVASNLPDQTANTSDVESCISGSSGSPINRTESHGVIDLSGGRTLSAMSKSNSVAPSGSDNNVGVFVSALTAGDSLCSLTDRLVARDSGQIMHSDSTYTHIVSAARMYNTAQENFGRESNNGDVIDLSKRNLPSLTRGWQNNKTTSVLDVLDLSGSDKRQQERHSVITSVRSATGNESAVKDMADDKDSSPAWSCPICFESLLSGQSVSSTHCGHVFCTKCIEEAVNQFKKCPTCCRKVALKRVHKIFL